MNSYNQVQLLVWTNVYDKVERAVWDGMQAAVLGEVGGVSNFIYDTLFDSTYAVVDRTVQRHRLGHYEFS